jgi:LuxR family transcriptional regulator, maltose regulon positive regulatory protein
MALAKTTRPSLANTIARSRLFRLLDHSRKGQITWVWGPPGVGKTTLIASYLVPRKLFNLWYQVDEGDNDIATFFYFLGLAAPRRRRPLPFLTPEYRQGISVFSRNFFRELYSRLKTPFVLIFDNYQEVPVDSPLHEVMREAVAEIPKGGHAIFISRSEPPPAFARLRSQRAIEILGWPQLRFTQTEATGLVRKLAPGRWSRNTINRLHTATDGWAAGLVLSLEQLRREGETSEKPKSQSYEVLFDYFAEEIFKKADPITQDVLLQTAFVPRVTASMAEKLTGQPDAGPVLVNLHKQNYFTNKLGGSEATYEYHPLFREFLLSQAHRTYSSAGLAKIRRIAAALLEPAGQVEVAAALLRDAEDWTGLAQLICRYAPVLLAQGRVQYVEEWLETIPEAMSGENPWLLYWRGMCRFQSRNADCQRDLERAFTLFRRQRHAAGIFSAWSSLIISYQGESNTVPIDRCIELLEELMQEAPEFPSEEIEMHVAAAMISAIAVRQPGHPDGARWAERAWNLARRHSDLSFRAITALNWCYYHYQLGDCAKAALVADEMRALMRTCNISPVANVLASMTVVWHELAYALLSYRDTVSEMLDLVRATGMSNVAKHATLSCGIKAALSDGDLKTADIWIREMEQDLDVLGPGYKGWYYASIIRMALLQGELERAVAQQPEMLRLSLAGGAPLTCVEALLVSAEVFGRCGKEQQARLHLDQALEVARTARSPYFEFMARLTEAQLHFHNGQEADGLRALSRGMELGRAGGFVNSFVWQPPVMAKLCAKALEAGIEVEYVQSLIRKRKLVPKEAPVEIESWPWPIKIYTLGRFEVFKDDERLQFKGKVQRKPLALLKAIIAFGGQHVREETLIDTLWPDTEGDAAHFALTSAIHRLRRLLGHEEAIIRKDNEVSLDNRYSWVDVWAVERWLGRVESAARDAIDEGAWSDTVRVVERAVELYKGPFLGGNGDIPWAGSLNDRLRRRLLRQLVQVGQYWEQAEDLQQAANLYEEGLRVDPCAEDVCRRLMTVYYSLGRPGEILATYRQCREELAVRLGSLPSVETDTLFQRLSSH